MNRPSTVHRRPGGALIALLPIAALVLASSFYSVAAASPRESAPYETTSLSAAQFRLDGPPVIFRADPNVSFHRTPPPARISAPLRVQSATFTINYLPAGSTDLFGNTCLSWPAEATTAFAYATEIWEMLINSSVAVVIDACWADLGEGILGQAGHSSARDFAGAPVPNTWYAMALANAIYGSDLDPSNPDMHLAYSKRFQDSNQWYFGTDGSTPGTQYDFASVVLHEIAHGLGFSGSMQVSAGLGSWGLGTPRYPASYDRFTEDGSGSALINTAVYHNPSAALAAALTSDDVWFDGPNASAANGGERVKLYAPDPWRQGSSYSHLDEAFNGTQNALMTYSLSSGESNHSPGPVTMGILEDNGWAMTAAEGTPTATRTLTPTPTRTATASATATRTRTPTATSTATSTPTHTLTRTPTPTATASGTPTRTATSTATLTPTPTATASATPTWTPTGTPTPTPTSTPPITIPGDLDGDCDVDIVDIMLVANRWKAALGDPPYDPGYDVDSDGDIDIADVMWVASHWGETC